MFHKFAAYIQECLILVVILDAPETRRRDNLYIEKLRKARVVKDELKKENALEKSSNKILYAVMLLSLY